MPNLPAMQNSTDFLGDLQQLNEMMAAKGMSLPPQWASMTPEDKKKFYDSVVNTTQQSMDVNQKLQENAQNQAELMKDIQNTGIRPQAKKSVFNLKKQAQMEAPPAAPMTAPAAPAPEAAPAGPSAAPAQAPAAPTQLTGPFADPGQLKNMLQQIGDANKAIELLATQFTNENQTIQDPNKPDRSSQALQVIKDAVNTFFSTDDEAAKMNAANTIYEMVLPDAAKAPQKPENAVQAPMKSNIKPGIAAMVNETNDIIKKLAQDHSKEAKKSVYNLKKEAQHKALNNVILYGPEQTTTDAFTGQPISSWHLVERNKGFGLRVDDVFDIDFESIWRGTIMDKYSRPYKDDKGNWVGGYIEKRFEVDKNIPEMNNLQLKPGEKRKPIMPEYGNIGSRLEASRTKMNKERGYEPSSKGQPFNWKKASAENKKKVTAQLEPPKTENEGLRLPGDPKPKNVTPNPLCRYCGGNIAKVGPGKTPGVCQNCDAQMPNPIMAPPQAPNAGVPVQGIAQNQRLGGIFFNGQKFIVHTSQAKVEFNSYNEAEQFRDQQAADGQNPLNQVKHKLNPQEQEMCDVADKLGIDG